MYNLPHFKEEDKGEITRFMHAHPFVTVCGGDADGRPVATQVPVLLKDRHGEMFIEGHIMKNTDHHKAFEKNPNALVLFTGAHTYVSASWYSDPVQASTWNYQSVHARGTLQFLSEDRLRNILDELTSLFEGNDQSPSLFKHLSGEYINRLIKAIIGFEIKVESIDNVFKLSQNRDEKSFHTIIEKLREGDADAKHVAAQMENIKSRLFSNEP